MTNYRAVGPVQFPEFSGTYVNMMPFVMGDPESVPDFLRDYQPMIDACELPDDELGRVGYLTVDERFVESGSHRRGGLHTEGFGSASWGGGGWGGSGGLYIANNVPQSCALYDARVDDSGPGGEVSDDQIRGVEGLLMPADVLYWLHDRVPHESLPVRGTHRQFFRVVTSEVSTWFARHSTPSPLGVQPRARVVHYSKFSKETSRAIPHLRP